VLSWLINTAASALVGLVVGSLIVGIVMILPFGKPKTEQSH
jgi:predicted DNA repair protein MutK